MKTPTRKQVVQALVLAGSVLATSSFALTIPGLQQTPRGEPYASASIENQQCGGAPNLNTASGREAA